MGIPPPPPIGSKMILLLCFSSQSKSLKGESGVTMSSSSDLSRWSKTKLTHRDVTEAGGAVVTGGGSELPWFRKKKEKTTKRWGDDMGGGPC